MQAGISTATLFQRLFNEQAIEDFNAHGVRNAEVFLTSYCEYEPSFASQLALRKGALNVHSVHDLTSQFEPQLYSNHPRVKYDAYHFLQKVLTCAQMLGASYYSFHGPARLKRTYQENFERVGKGTQEVYEYCKAFGVTLCFENVEWAFYNRPGVFKKLKEYCPELKGVLDIKQARISGYDYREYLNEMAGDIAHVHVSDFNAEGKMCLPGQGCFDFKELLSRLKDVGFDGTLFIENYQGDYGSLDELYASYRYLCELCEQFS